MLFVGDSGVGKTGLAHRLTTGTPPGQLVSTDAAWATQWPLPHEPGAGHGEREIWLWNFAGQPDYRLAHPLYMDDTALAVFVFDPQDRNPLAGLAEWDRMMTRAAKRPSAKLLVAGRCDRGGPIISQALIDQFRQEHGFGLYLETSAHTGLGCDQLAKAIVEHIDWDAIPYTVSSDTFRALKNVIVGIKDRVSATRKGKPATVPVLLSHEALADVVAKERKGKATFSEDDFRAVIGLLHGPGVVWKLEFGELVLLQPERINAYAAALVRKAHRNIDEIGVIPESEVLAGDLDYSDKGLHLRRVDVRVRMGDARGRGQPRGPAPPGPPIKTLPRVPFPLSPRAITRPAGPTGNPGFGEAHRAGGKRSPTGAEERRWTFSA